VAIEPIQFTSWDHRPGRQEVEAALAESGLPPPLPHLPDGLFGEDETEPAELFPRFKVLFEQFRNTGWWPSADEAERFFSGRREMPTPPAAEG
jgi:hypothetical protein